MKVADNDNVSVYNIRGTSWANDLHKSLLEMSLTSELTNTDKGLYHVQICPAYGEDRKMTDQDWLRAAEILEAETGFTGQKRIMVLHDKNGRQHMHVAYERYDHDKGIMKSDSFSRLAQDRARVKMEREFNQQKTPERNEHRPAMKELLTKLWKETTTADEFMKIAATEGYTIAAGTQRPYMVVDMLEKQSFNLLRQLDGVKTKEVRERFKKTKLAKEKEVLEAIPQKKKRQPSRQISDSKPEKEKDKSAKPDQTYPEVRNALKKAANDNMADMIAANDNQKKQKRSYEMKGSFIIGGNDAAKSEEQLKSAIQKQLEKEAKRQEILKQMKEELLQKARDFRENERDMGR